MLGKERRKLIVLRHRENKGSKNTPVLPRKYNREMDDISKFESHLAEMGIDATVATQRLRARSASRTGRKRSRSETMDIDQDGTASSIAKRRRSVSKTPAQEGLRDEKQKMKVEKLAKKVQKPRNKQARKGEADRHIPDLKPKHLFSGKRGAGKTERR